MRTRDREKEKMVIEKAIELLVKDGFEGFSMGKLAKACNISVATLYIYYRDKDDLIKKLGVEEVRRMMELMTKDFSPDMSFEEGLKKQWENRAGYVLTNPNRAEFSEIILNSPHCKYVLTEVNSDLKVILETFIQKAINHKELLPMPMAVFWSVAYGPLYNLLRFHKEAEVRGKSFTFSNEIMYQTLELVLKALKP
ncbi:TetR/AcrR family transcriptional regulator [Rhodocytophaga rosea]|uniref:TetR/AcrR family transcriptional regulator n=1 Tax=Rhodocytophaga rosea TaxID=2704465 RepID=A0A6C0GD51_9BACT|nr:TetR/AcrR family transcriptional regulator [Rhodocytophaga rosea]QHT65682.1 TetR/AcrR family transcriptional regulator [Rhodocytophaga rosea]